MKFNRLSFFLGITALFFSLLPFMVNLTIPVIPGRVNPFWDNWPYDFTYYRSIIVQGKNGRLTTLDKYTSEPQTGKLLRIGYLALGHLAGVFRLTETAAYHLARIFLGIIFVYLTYRLIKFSLYPVKPILVPIAFFLALFIPGYPEMNCQPHCRLIPRLWYFTYLDPLKRLMFMPHFVWGQIAFLGVFLVLLDRGKHSWKQLAGAAFLLGIAGLDHPPSLIFIYPLLILSVLSLSWKKMITFDLIKRIGLVFLFSLPGLVYLYSATAAFPWNLTREASYPLYVDFPYFSLAMGPAFIIGSLAALAVLLTRNRQPEGLVILSGWLISIILLTFVIPASGFYSQTRFIQVAPQIPAVILTAYAGWIVFRKVRLYFTRKKAILIAKIIALLIFIPALPTLCLLYYDQLDNATWFTSHSLEFIPYPPVIDYPPREWMAGFDWLKINSTPNTIVLSDFTAGNFIPAYAGNTVYYGHEIETYRAEEKKQAVVNFFSSVDRKEQEKFLVDNKIDYIFYGPQEKAYRQTKLEIPGLEPVYINSLVTIYEATAYVSPISIDYLRTLAITSGSVKIEEQLPDGANYKRYLASYLSEGNKVFGLLTIPLANQPEGGFPAVIFNHGYIPPAQYKTTEGYAAYVDYLAKNGLVVFKIDYRGNGNSEGDPSGTYFSSAYTIDALSALKALQKFNQVNPDRIGIWGHSMAGNLVLRAMLASGEIKAGVIWAGAVYSYKDFATYGISDTSYVHRPDVTKKGEAQKDREISPEIQKIRSDLQSIDFGNPFWQSISLTANLSYLSHPLQIHHALNDTTVNIGYSRDLVEVLKSNNKDCEFYEYPGGGHNLASPHFETAMQRTVEFFKDNL